MSKPGPSIIKELGDLATCYKSGENITTAKEGTYLVAPLSASFLDDYVGKTTSGLQFNEVWRYRRHLNLDDLDFGDDGVWPTLKRVVGRRGLAVWRVTKNC